VKILLTRSKIDSLETSKILREKMWDFEIAPLIDVKKTYRFKKFIGVDVIMFTSKNGIRYFDDKNILFNKNLRIFAVGSGTKKLLEETGVSNVFDSDGDLKELKKKITRFLKSGMKVLHPTSNIVEESLMDFFSNYGCDYFPVECYRSNMKNIYPEIFKKFIKTNKNGIITLYSSRTARSFCNEIIKFNLDRYCFAKKFVVISETVKNELRGLNIGKIFIADKPNEKNMIKTLMTVFGSGEKK